MAEVHGTKEIMEALDGLKLLATDIKAILQDGKVNMNDIPAAMHLLQNWGVVSAAGRGYENLLPEAKDLSVEESQAVLAKVFEVVHAIKG